MIYSGAMKVWNVIHEGDDYSLFKDRSKQIYNLDNIVFAFNRENCNLAHLIEDMENDSIDICFYHPNDFGVGLDADMENKTAKIIIYSAEYTQLKWLNQSIVKAPREFVIKYRYQIVREVQKRSNCSFRDIINLIYSIGSSEADDSEERHQNRNQSITSKESSGVNEMHQESEDRHKFRNRFGPASLLEMIKRDGHKMDHYDKYINDQQNNEGDDQEKSNQGYSNSVDLPFELSSLIEDSATTSFEAMRLLIVDDDHRRGWSALLTFLVNGSVESLYELEPKQESDTGYIFKEEHCSDKSLSSENIKNIWQFSEVINSSKKFSIAVQQVGKKLPESGGRTGASDISAIKSLVAKNDIVGVQKQLIPCDLAFIDYRAQNEKVNVETEEISGLEIVKLLKQIDPSLPTIMFTASAKASTVLALLKYDILGYYQKPGRSVSKKDLQNYAHLKKLIQTAKDYWWLRFIWGASIWLADEETQIRSEFSSDEFNNYLLSRMGFSSDDNKTEASRLIKEIVTKRLEQITRLTDTQRMADAGTIDSMATPGLNSELASQLGMIGDYLTGGAGAGEPENPNKKIIPVFGNSVLFYCIQISRTTRNIAAHGENDMLKNHLVIVIQLMSILKMLFDSNILDEVVSFVPKKYFETTLDTQGLMANLKNHILENGIIVSEDYCRGKGKIVKTYTMGKELRKNVMNHAIKLGLGTEIENLETRIQEKFVSSNMRSDERELLVAKILQNYFEDHKLPDLFLVFFAFFKDQVVKRNDELLLCTNYLLLARQIELSEETDRDFILLRNLLLTVAKQTIDSL